MHAPARMRSFIVGCLVVVFCGVAFSRVASGQQTPSGEKRIALVIGVGDYTGTKFPSLPGIGTDLSRMKATLNAAGFQTTVLENPTLTTTEEAIDTFGARL